MECDNVVDMHKTISNFNQQVKLWHTPQLSLNFYPAKQIIREDLKLSNRLWEATNQTVGRDPWCQYISNGQYQLSFNGVVVVKQHMPWDGLNGGRTRCWWIRERGTS
jgi:hypothetical protein